jgi:UDP-N-acetylglucosamine/UDP-N-acetylgalactosamine 4-epimerase
MSKYEQVRQELERDRRTWLVTGVAGFIGSNLLETLLSLNQRVIGLDNFATGKQHNLEHVRKAVGEQVWPDFLLIRDNIENLQACHRACSGVDYVLHQAALGSVPRSIEDPQSCHASNVTGTLNMLQAAERAKVKRFVYASSSAIYGDHPGLPKVEEQVGRPLSPYAASKAACEEYAEAFAAAYGLGSIGLRYFNVFGPRQDPDGAYAAVIPKWFSALLKQEPVQINGDGETSRDFCFVENVVQANVLAATAQDPRAVNEVYNVALGERTTLNELFNRIQASVLRVAPDLTVAKPVYRDFRAGDVRHSLANIDKARNLLGFAPTHRIGDGLELATEWYAREVAS